tara:strand:- start:591 stop:1163 length:573 start_codon:yes stop_codon:yes gene_type:complete
MAFDFYTREEQKIIFEIKKWSEESLETSNKNFNGLAACPKAKNAWKEDKVGFVFKNAPDYQDLYTVVSCYPSNFDMVIVVDTCFKEEAKDFHTFISGFNEAIGEGMFINRNAWVVGFHPDDGGNALLKSSLFPTSTSKEYAVMLVQPLSLLQETSEKIEPLGYYKGYEDEYNADSILQNRKDLYRRLIGD